MSNPRKPSDPKWLSMGHKLKFEAIAATTATGNPTLMQLMLNRMVG